MTIGTENVTHPILVTGAAGFIGARFVDSCRDRGHKVISVDAEEHFRERTELAPFVAEPIVDRGRLLAWLRDETPPLSAVVHLGACSDTTNLDVAHFDEVNVRYSQALWSYAAEHDLPFVYASSAATYGDGAHGYDDDESRIGELVPLNPYGDSKQIFDVWALDQERSDHAPPRWAGFKFFNVYGFGERHKKKMASVALHAYDQIAERGSVRLFRSHRDGIADGHQKRDFIFVDDVLDVLHFALRKPIPRGIFNLGTGEARTFLDLVRAVFAALDEEENIEFIDTPEALRERYQYFTEARMEKLGTTGYSQPFTSLEDGVRRYMERLEQQNE